MAPGCGQSWRWFREHCILILVLNWMVWGPMVFGIYCLPYALQLPVQNLVLCMWSLLLMFLTRTEPETQPA